MPLFAADLITGECTLPKKESPAPSTHTCAHPRAPCPAQASSLLIDSFDCLPSQLKDAASEQILIEVLGNFGRPQSGAMMSQAPGPAPPTMVEACAVAFDFFDGLVGSQPSLAMAAELLSLLRTLVETQRKAGGDDVPTHCKRHERLASLAQGCLEREELDSRRNSTWKEKAPSAALVKLLFDSQASCLPQPFSSTAT